VKTITIRLSSRSSAAVTLADIDRDIPDSIRSNPTFDAVYEQVKSSVHDFIAKAQRLAHPGTALHLKKEIVVANVRFVIILDTSPKRSLADKIKALFR
jgi:hypothetical protein